MEITSGRDKQKIIFGILLATLLSFATVIMPGIILQHFGVGYKSILIISRVLFWVCLFILTLYATRIEKNNFLLWPEKKYPFTFYLGAYPALFGILFFGIAIINIILVKALHFPTNGSKLNVLLDLFRQNKWLLYVTVITAGVVEEFIFRGYLMPRLQLVFKTKFLTIFISSALFGLMHFTYGNVIQVVGPFYIGLIFALFYEKYKNIKMLIIFHTFWDLFAIWLLLMQHGK